MRFPSSWSSGFSPPLCYQASSALSHQYSPWICHPLTPYRFRVSLSARFYGAFDSSRRQVRRASLGKTHPLPVFRPASHRFGSPDIRPRLATTACPPPQRHIAGSLSATYTGSASCFLQTAHLEGQRVRHARRTWSPTGKPVAPLCFANSLCERRDLVARHPARPIPLYLNPCDGPHSSTAKAVAFCERGKLTRFWMPDQVRHDN